MRSMPTSLSPELATPLFAVRTITGKNNADFASHCRRGRRPKGKAMTLLQVAKTEAFTSSATRSGRLLPARTERRARIHSMNPDGSDRKTIVADLPPPRRYRRGRRERMHVYWTNMGIPNRDDGSIERADLDGGNRRIIVPQGVTHTPKQIHLDKENGKLYWSDREGMRVMRANLDGSQVETLVVTGRGDEDAARRRRGGAWESPVDPELGKSLLDAKRPGRRAGRGPSLPRQRRPPEGREPGEPLRPRGCCSIKLPEPIDLELDLGEPRSLLDRPRRPPARQHRQSRADRQEGGAGDRRSST